MNKISLSKLSRKDFFTYLASKKVLYVQMNWYNKYLIANHIKGFMNKGFFYKLGLFFTTILILFNRKARNIINPCIELVVMHDYEYEVVIEKGGLKFI